jgi:glycosyltransferase involved in cell wall biosynthesis
MKQTIEVTRMSRRLVIHAPNVHQGGGRTLLLALLSSLSHESRGEAILDSRLEIPFAIPDSFAVTRVRPSLGQRLRIEHELPGKAGPESHLLCFHSLPPLRRCQAFVSVFVQNRHVIANTDLSEFPLRVRLRIHLERAWFRARLHTVDEFIVQTETMRDLLRDVVGGRLPIRVMPFLPASIAGSDMAIAGPNFERFDFCYIATGEPNKNHRRLIEAWSLLAQAGHFPSLCLTLDAVRFPQLTRWIDEQVRQYGLKVRNFGYVSLEQTSGIYTRSTALIYPSRYESFGLPLLEARRHRLKIAAPELDYVRDVIEPDATFDPESPRSIARAAQRLLGLDNQRVPILDDQSFVRQLFAA